MTSKTVRELVQSICPALQHVSLHSLFKFSGHTSYLFLAVLQPQQTFWSKGVPTLSISWICQSLLKCHLLGEILFFFFCVFLFIIVFLHCMRVCGAYGLAPFTTVVSSICTRVPNTQELLSTGALRGWVGWWKEEQAAARECACLVLASDEDASPGPRCIVSIQHSFAK